MRLEKILFGMILSIGTVGLSSCYSIPHPDLIDEQPKLIRYEDWVMVTKVPFEVKYLE
ncbi:MAG: hypothetical protein WC548_02930 [Candidatus Pacearchaeota archaeon]